MQTFIRRAMSSESSGMRDHMEHWRTTSLFYLDYRNIGQRSAAVFLQVFMHSYIRWVVAGAQCVRGRRLRCIVYHVVVHLFYLSTNLLVNCATDSNRKRAIAKALHLEGHTDFAPDVLGLSGLFGLKILFSDLLRSAPGNRHGEPIRPLCAMRMRVVGGCSTHSRGK